MIGGGARASRQRVVEYNWLCALDGWQDGSAIGPRFSGEQQQRRETEPRFNMRERECICHEREADGAMWARATSDVGRHAGFPCGGRAGFFEAASGSEPRAPGRV